MGTSASESRHSQSRGMAQSDQRHRNVTAPSQHRHSIVIVIVSVTIKATVQPRTATAQPQHNYSTATAHQPTTAQPQQGDGGTHCPDTHLGWPGCVEPSDEQKVLFLPQIGHNKTKIRSQAPISISASAASKPPWRAWALSRAMSHGA